MPTLHFKGKDIIRTHHLSVPYRQLEPRPRKSVLPAKGKPSLNDNLILHGDNLEALKALLPSFQGKIKCIYIDPPYNTGNENWAYNDAVNSPMHREWLKGAVNRDDLTRHDKWLCMMWPRLTLLRDLLSEDGAIFISIDDNEVHHLRAVMDEIFGEQNFIAQIIWQRKRGRDNSAKFFSKSHEYVVCYTRKQEAATIYKLTISAATKTAYKNPDNDSRGVYRLLGVWARGTQGGSKFKFKSKSGQVFSEREWLVNLDSIKKLDEENKLVFVGDKVYRKLFLSEHEGSVPETIWYDASNAANAADEMKVVFGEQAFETPKPVPLIKRIIEIATDTNSIILDSFAGSGTTAHAVLALNAEDGGNRRFILIEQENYADTITAERVRRVIKGVPNAKDEKLKQGYGGSFSYFTLGPRLDDDSILHGKEMPAYKDLARYVFFTATGEQWDESQLDETRFYLGESQRYHVYLIYRPDVDFIKNTPLNLDFALALPPFTRNVDKLRLVIASHKYLDADRLREYGIEFCQLPFSIYKFRA